MCQSSLCSLTGASVCVEDVQFLVSPSMKICIWIADTNEANQSRTYSNRVVIGYVGCTLRTNGRGEGGDVLLLADWCVDIVQISNRTGQQHN